MRKLISIVLLLIVSVISSAQLGDYRKNIVLKYQNDIVKSNETSITIATENMTTVCLFDRGLCVEMYLGLNGIGDRDIIAWLDSDSTYIKSEKGNWWFYGLPASDGGFYHTIVKLWYDDGDKPYIYAYLNKRLED